MGTIADTLRTGDIVKVRQDFIDSFGRDDINSLDTWRVMDIRYIGSGKRMADIKRTGDGTVRGFCVEYLIKIS